MSAMEKQAKRTLILDAAEKRARTGGYNGFSFRDIASDVGIKSASVHYHFATKEALAESLVDRYTARTMEALGAPEDHTPPEAFDKVAGLFLQSDERDDLMCLCGVFGAESGMLTGPLNEGVAAYFDNLTEWLSRAMSQPGELDCAQHLVAALEGGLIMSRVKSDPKNFRRLVAKLRATVKDVASQP